MPRIVAPFVASLLAVGCAGASSRASAPAIAPSGEESAARAPIAGVIDGTAWTGRTALAYRGGIVESERDVVIVPFAISCDALDRGQLPRSAFHWVRVSVLWIDGYERTPPSAAFDGARPAVGGRARLALGSRGAELELEAQGEAPDADAIHGRIPVVDCDPGIALEQ